MDKRCLGFIKGSIHWKAHSKNPIISDIGNKKSLNYCTKVDSNVTDDGFSGIIIIQEHNINKN